MSIPSVSVVVAAYNAAPFIERGLRSAFAQRDVTLEIIVVDDRSNDETSAVVARLAAQDSRISLLQTEQNGGPSLARNVGIDAARGEWVAILDADDAYLPDRLRTMLDAARRHQADIILDNYHSYNVGHDRIAPPAMETGQDDAILDAAAFINRARPFLQEADLGVAKPMFRRSFLDAHRLRYPTHTRHGEDFLMMASALLAGGRCVLVHTPGYLYTDRSSGFSRTVFNHKGLIEQTRQLLSDARVAENADVRDAVEKRVTGLERLLRLHDYDGYVRERQYGPLALRCLRDAVFRSVVRQKLRARIKRQLKPLFKARTRA